jgi:hypothetical protein
MTKLEWTVTNMPEFDWTWASGELDRLKQGLDGVCRDAAKLVIEEMRDTAEIAITTQGHEWIIELSAFTDSASREWLTITTPLRAAVENSISCFEKEECAEMVAMLRELADSIEEWHSLVPCKPLVTEHIEQAD